MESPISPVHSLGLPTSLEAWDAQAVARWLDSLGLGQHARSFSDHGLTGNVLPLVDDQALADIGIRSVGQRVALLNALYSLKRQHGIPIRVGQDYIPASLANATTASNEPATAPQIESDDPRIAALELHVVSLSATIKALQRSTTPNVPAPSMGILCTSCGRYACTCFAAGTPQSAPEDATLPPAVANQSSLPPRRKVPTSSTSPRPLASPSSPPSPPHSASSAPPGPSRPLASTPGSTSAQTSLSHTDVLAPTSRAASANSLRPPFSQTDGTPNRNITIPDQDEGSPSQVKEHGATDVRTQHTDRVGSRKEDRTSPNPPRPLRAAAPPPPPNATPPTEKQQSTVALANDTAGVATQVKSTDLAGGSTGSPSAGTLSEPSGERSGSVYKSFRVTMEDPTDRVLPAALKKYKIVDDWKHYVLFICYSSVPGASGAGDQERCMSLGERPLLLFQKLREQQQNPVFMLRHIRDVKSPVAIAKGKALAAQAAREQDTRKRSLGEGNTNDPNNAAAIDSTASFLTTTDDSPPPVLRSQVAARREWLIASRLGLDPPLATDDINLRTWAGPNVSTDRASAARLVGPGGTLTNPPPPTYAVAIYPYNQERADELDVTVGDSYIVLSKSKGWWIVQGDPTADGSGAYDYDPLISAPGSLPGPTDAGKDLPLVRNTGWVPAGCLLEMSRPLLGPSACNHLLKHVVSLPIAPSVILSTSTPGTVLMTYDAQSFAAAARTTGSPSKPGAPPRDSALDEVDTWLLPKETHLRVFKRYNHWSYCVQESGSYARGWVPSWFIGKSLSKCRTPRGTGTQATTAQGAHSNTPSTPVMNAAVTGLSAGAASGPDA